MFILIVFSMLIRWICADVGYNYQISLVENQNGLGGSSNRGSSNEPLNPSSSDYLSNNQQGSPETSYQKEFYSYSAPEEQFDESNADQQIANVLKKNLRVVFIKTPENKGLENALVNLAQQAGDQQTAIYILSKQTDIGDLTNRLNTIKTGKRPEVHFVKYRTPQDALNAEQAIRAQYNQLPGPSKTSNEGEAPVLSFVSAASRPDGKILPGPGAQYLPANPLPSLTFLQFRKTR